MNQLYKSSGNFSYNINIIIGPYIVHNRGKYIDVLNAF